MPNAAAVRTALWVACGSRVGRFVASDSSSGLIYYIIRSIIGDGLTLSFGLTNLIQSLRIPIQGSSVTPTTTDNAVIGCYQAKRTLLCKQKDCFFRAVVRSSKTPSISSKCLDPQWVPLIPCRWSTAFAAGVSPAPMPPVAPRIHWSRRGPCPRTDPSPRFVEGRRREDR